MRDPKRSTTVTDICLKLGCFQQIYI